MVVEEPSSGVIDSRPTNNNPDRNPPANQHPYGGR
jgi:hypothetical protein